MTQISPATRSFVVTGGARGIGAAIVRRLGVDGHVVVVDTTPPAEGIERVVGDATDPAVAARAAERAESLAPMAGWVNNAAVFADASLADDLADVLDPLRTNLALAVVGTRAAVRHLREHGRSGAIVNVSSHQGARPVRGALPYATAKAAIEGLTRAAAVDHGPDGIRVNAVALGSIRTDRYERYRAANAGVEVQMAALHPLGRVGEAQEVAEAVTFLLSPSSSYITGAVLPVDGGRGVLGQDPEAR